MKIGFMAMRMQKQLFRPDANVTCKKGIFSIPSLDIQNIFKIVIKITISDCQLYLFCPSVCLSLRTEDL